MQLSLKSFWALFKRTVTQWLDQDVPRMGAALAFYTLFSIAPLFIIVLAVAGVCFGEEAAHRELFSQVSGLVGSEGGETLQALISAANKPTTGAWASLAAAVTLLIGATSVFVQLQDALNTVWGVRRIPGRGLLYFITDRLLSFALILGIGFLLLVSLIVSAGLSAVENICLAYIWDAAAPRPCLAPPALWFSCSCGSTTPPKFCFSAPPSPTCMPAKITRHASRLRVPRRCRLREAPRAKPPSRSPPATPEPA